MIESPELRIVARRLDRALARHGYLSSMASEYALGKPCENPRMIGDHARFLCQEALAALDSSEEDEARELITFAQGVVWALGVYSIEELRFIREDH